VRPQAGTLIAAVCVVLVVSLPAQAGMPAPYTLRELAKLRIEAISFFLLVFALCAGLVMWIWNMLRAEDSRLPRLTYLKAVGVVFLWGLLFSIVLTMISGARELMTPGAWEKTGATYRLVPPGTPK
jgi:hypothetical protein